MTYEDFCELVEDGANPFLLAFEDPELEPLCERWFDEHREAERSVPCSGGCGERLTVNDFLAFGQLCSSCQRERDLEDAADQRSER